MSRHTTVLHSEFCICKLNLELNKSRKLHSDSSNAVNLNYLWFSLTLDLQWVFQFWAVRKCIQKNFWMNNTDPIMNIIISFCSQPHFFLFFAWCTWRECIFWRSCLFKSQTWSTAVHQIWCLRPRVLRSILNSGSQI